MYNKSKTKIVNLGSLFHTIFILAKKTSTVNTYDKTNEKLRWVTQIDPTSFYPSETDDFFWHKPARKPLITAKVSYNNIILTPILFETGFNVFIDKA